MSAPLHVGLNLIFLVPGETGGMEVSAREFIPHLIAAAPEMRFTAFINREAQESGDGPWGELLPAVTVPVRAASRPQWVWGEQALLPGLARRHGIDLMHSLGNIGPNVGDFRRVVTIHDLIYKVYPESHFGIRSLGVRLLVPLSTRTAHRVIAVSENTRRDLEKRLGVPATKIDVVPLGHGYKVMSDEAVSEAELRRALGLGDRRVLFTLSAKRPHKNLARLLQALALISLPQRPVLILPGYPTIYETELRRLASELALDNDVRFLEWTTRATVEGLYAICACFVFPSLYEGFGLPVVEAMARGVPVACSDRGAVAEVAGDATVLFEPESPEDIAAAITRVMSDDALAARLRRLGPERARRFTWERTAQGAIATYRRTLDV